MSNPLIPTCTSAELAEIDSLKSEYKTQVKMVVRGRYFQMYLDKFNSLQKIAPEGARDGGPKLAGLGVSFLDIRGDGNFVPNSQQWLYAYWGLEGYGIGGSGREELKDHIVNLVKLQANDIAALKSFEEKLMAAHDIGVGNSFVDTINGTGEDSNTGIANQILAGIKDVGDIMGLGGAIVHPSAFSSDDQFTPTASWDKYRRPFGKNTRGFIINAFRTTEYRIDHGYASSALYNNMVSNLQQGAAFYDLSIKELNQVNDKLAKLSHCTQIQTCNQPGSNVKRISAQYVSTTKAQGFNSGKFSETTDDGLTTDPAVGDIDLKIEFNAKEISQTEKDIELIKAIISSLEGVAGSFASAPADFAQSILNIAPTLTSITDATTRVTAIQECIDGTITACLGLKATIGTLINTVREIDTPSSSRYKDNVLDILRGISTDIGAQASKIHFPTIQDAPFNGKSIVVLTAAGAFRAAFSHKNTYIRNESVRNVSKILFQEVSPSSDFRNASQKTREGFIGRLKNSATKCAESFITYKDSVSQMLDFTIKALTRYNDELLRLKTERAVLPQQRTLVTNEILNDKTERLNSEFKAYFTSVVNALQFETVTTLFHSKALRALYDNGKLTPSLETANPVRTRLKTVLTADADKEQFLKYNEDSGQITLELDVSTTNEIVRKAAGGLASQDGTNDPDRILGIITNNRLEYEAKTEGVDPTDTVVGFYPAFVKLNVTYFTNFLGETEVPAFEGSVLFNSDPAIKTHFQIVDDGTGTGTFKSNLLSPAEDQGFTTFQTLTNYYNPDYVAVWDGDWWKGTDPTWKYRPT